MRQTFFFPDQHQSMFCKNDQLNPCAIIQVPLRKNILKMIKVLSIIVLLFKRLKVELLLTISNKSETLKKEYQTIFFE